MTNYRQTMSQALEYMHFVKETNVLERELTDKELKRREEIAKDLDDQEFKDRYGKDWMQVKMGTATKMAKAEDLDEKADVSLKKKAEKSGISAGILKQVYNRGVAAWRTGHRPGTTPEQWGHARVNSFISKSSGTWGGSDKDLAAKARGQKEEVELDEGKMSQIDQMMKDGKSAKEIAKALKMDVKAVKKVMGEEVADQYTEASYFTVQSMRDRLHQVWGEAKEEFPDHKDDEKKIKGKKSKTDTGKDAAVVDVKPEIKERKK